MTDALFGIFAFGMGACIGSFLNVCVARWPAGMSIVSPPSRCPECERPIRAYENVPIFGWLALRGRCAGCALPISTQYPLVELLVALLWLGAGLLFGPTVLALRVAIFATLMLGVSITDAKHYVIPDGFTVFGLIWLLVTAFASLFTHAETPFAAPYDALIGAFTGAGAIAVIGWLGEVALKREAMGFGDATLMAVVGAAVGPQRALLTIFIAAALGVVVFACIVVPFSRRRAHGIQTTQSEVPATGGDPTSLPLVPFGVFLAPASLIALFYGDVMIQWYVSRVLSA